MRVALRGSIRALPALVVAAASGEASSSSIRMDDDNISPASQEQQAAGAGILLQIVMLVLAFVVGHILRRKKLYIIPEASASLLIGTFMVIAVICLRFSDLLGLMLFFFLGASVGLIVGGVANNSKIENNTIRLLQCLSLSFGQL